MDHFVQLTEFNEWAGFLLNDNFTNNQLIKFPAVSHLQKRRHLTRLSRGELIQHSWRAWRRTPPIFFCVQVKAGWQGFDKDSSCAWGFLLDLRDQFKNAEAVFHFVLRITGDKIFAFRQLSVSVNEFWIDNQVLKLEFPEHRDVRADFQIFTELREKGLPFFIGY